MSEEIFNIEELSSIPPEANPFHHSMEMGQRMGTNVYVMFANHEHREMPYMTIVHIPTGHRIRVTFPSSCIMCGDEVAPGDGSRSLMGGAICPSCDE